MNSYQNSIINNNLTSSGSFKKYYPGFQFKIIFIVTVILIISLSVTFRAMGKRYENLLYSQNRLKAETLYRQILLTREWLADHDITSAQKLSPQKRSQSDITDSLPKKPYSSETSDKRNNKRKNVVKMIKEISGYAKKEGVFWYHMTSLDPVNPENAPDDFEKEGMTLFSGDRQITEFFRIEEMDNKTFFRYIAPLYVEESCLKCHARYGDKNGEIRGALSITIPSDDIVELVKKNKRETIFITYMISAIIVLSLFFTIHIIVVRPLLNLISFIKEYGKRKSGAEAPYSSGDEIADLRKTFIYMTKELDDYHNGLDFKVKDAVKNLKETNTRLIEANNKLAEINVKKSDFIACISHEMRTPLTSIKGAMDYIFERIKNIDACDGETKDIKEFCGIVKNNADRLIKIVNNTIDMERLELGRLEMHIIPVYLTYLIIEVVKGFMAIINKRNIEINVNLESEIRVYADSDRIKQVLINLINNAINFTEEGGSIEVRSYPAPGGAITEITDYGPGIADEEREHIFQKYYKKGSHYGSGLGLAICKGIIEAHNGEIGLFNTQDRGCTFYFKLQMAEV